MVVSWAGVISGTLGGAIVTSVLKVATKLGSVIPSGICPFTRGGPGKVAIGASLIIACVMVSINKVLKTSGVLAKTEAGICPIGVVTPAGCTSAIKPVMTGVSGVSSV